MFYCSSEPYHVLRLVFLEVIGTYKCILVRTRLCWIMVFSFFLWFSSHISSYILLIYTYIRKHEYIRPDLLVKEKLSVIWACEATAHSKETNIRISAIAMGMSKLPFIDMTFLLDHCIFIIGQREDPFTASSTALCCYFYRLRRLQFQLRRLCYFVVYCMACQAVGKRVGNHSTAEECQYGRMTRSDGPWLSGRTDGWLLSQRRRPYRFVRVLLTQVTP